MKRFKKILFAALLLLPTFSRAQVYVPGEVLHYSVAYKAKMVPNTEMAYVDMQTTLEQYNGRPVYHVYGIGSVRKGFRWMYNLEDKYWIWADTVTGKTVRFQSDIKEGKSYTFKSHYSFDWKNHRVETWSQRKQDTPKTKTMALTDSSMDAVSLYYNLRSADISDFEVGKPRQLEMVLEDTIRYLKYRYLGRENVRTPKGLTFDTMKFMCQIGTSESFSFTDGSEFTIWISNDLNKIPVMLESPIKVGKVRAYINSWEGLKFPFTSLQWKRGKEK